MGFCKNCGGWVLKEDLKCPKCGLDPNVTAENPAAAGDSASADVGPVGRSSFSLAAFVDPLKKSFASLWANPHLYIVGLLVGVPTVVLQGSVERVFYYPFGYGSEMILLAVLFVIFSLIGVFFFGGGLSAADAMAKGAAFSIGGFIQGGKRNYLRLLVAEVLYFAAILAVMLPSVFLGCLGILFLVPAVWFAVALSFYAVIIVVEDVGAIESFKRSYSFVRNNLGNVIGYVVLGSLVSFVLASPSFIYSTVYEVLSLPDLSEPFGFLVLWLLSMFSRFDVLFSALSYSVGVLYGVLFYRSLTKDRK